MTGVPQPPSADSLPGALVEVAVALPVFDTFTYFDPRPGMRPPVGAQVIVPFGPRRVTGIVVGYAETAPVALKPIDEVVEEAPVLDAEMLELCRWAARYYLAPLGEVLRAALPGSERAATARRARITVAGRQLLKREANGEYGFDSIRLAEEDRALLRRLAARPLSVRGIGKQPGEAARVGRLEEQGLVQIGDEVRAKAGGATGLGAEATIDASEAAGPALNEHQRAALETLTGALAGGYAPFVLQGITGSGKTEVYLRLIAEARRAGKGALVLVPEIALTPQLAARFRARFGDDVAVLHSALAPADRRAAWRRLRAGEVGIALGARSAVFAPVRALAVIVVDEEHDSSFKQEEGLRYNARDLALVRAQRTEAVAVLGSATPSLESYRNVLLGRYRRLLLPTRANPTAAERPLPPVEIIDMRRHPPGPDGLLSPPLAEALARTLAAGEQSILFLNRRGFATFILCRACGHVLRCDDCAVSMTYHRGRDRLVCHYCGRIARQPARCPACEQPALEGLGTGTERVESVVRERFPDARVARLDRDTADADRRRGLERLLAQVHAREIDILVGTQMVTKGHDFTGVTLVGVLQPDQGMHLPDFRAAERTFQLLEQVAGRAGRAERPGRVLVQTYSADHPAIQALGRHDYEGFVRGELSRREEAQYPPFSRMICLRVDGPEESAVRAAAQAAAAKARQAGPGVRVLGPAEAPIARLRGRTRWQVWLSGRDRAPVSQAAALAARAQLPRDVRLVVDVDPQSVL